MFPNTVEEYIALQKTNHDTFNNASIEEFFKNYFKNLKEAYRYSDQYKKELDNIK